MEWWAHPVHASMLFKSERKIDIQLWESLPPTNKPKEVIHWKLYSACGHDHAFLEGMYSLYTVAVYYECLYEGSSSDFLSIQSYLLIQCP